MKRYLSLLFFVSTACWATTNQLEFNWGHGLPESSLQAGGSSDRAGSQGTEWSADFLHQSGQNMYVGLGGGQFRSNDNVSPTFVANTNSTISARSTSILVLTRVDLSPPSRMMPYVIAGLGWVHNSLLITNSAGPQTLMNDTHNTVGFATGIGIDYAMSDRLFIGAEARYQSALKRTFGMTPEGAAATGTQSIQTSMTSLFYGIKAGIKY